MIALDQYIDDVLAWIPAGEQRDRIEMDLRAHAADRVERGERLEDIIRQFGEPRALAESYLASVPLRSASFVSRAAAALIDIPSVFLAGFLIFYTGWKLFGPADKSFVTAVLTGNPMGLALGFIALAVMSPLYYVIAESTFGQTVGKALLGLRVVRESGAKISVGQAFVRQIPLMCSFYAIDVLFALFTEKKQRAFELISKTRVVRA